jgi:Bacterial Ig-like domain
MSMSRIKHWISHVSLVLLVAACGRVGGTCDEGASCTDVDANPGQDANVDAGPPDFDPPTLLSTTPTDQDTAIEPGVAITAQFSEAILPSSATATTFRLAFADGEPVPGTLSVAGAVVTFTPDARLAPNRSFEATITAGITDLAGNALAAGRSFTFETRPGAWTAATPLETSTTTTASDLRVTQNGDYAIAVWRQLSCSSPSSCGPDSELWASIYHDGVWSPHAVVTTSDVIQPKPGINRSGKAMVVWYDGGSPTSIHANYFDGTTWSADTNVEVENLGNASFPDVALDETGKAYAVWQQSDGTSENIWANIYDGSAWGTAEKIELGPETGGRPSVIVTSNGRVVAAWEQGGDQWGNDYMNGAWGGRDLLSSDSGYPTNLVAGADGSVSALWRGADMQTSRFTGSWTSPFAVDDSADLLIVGSDLAIDSRNHLMAVWIQGTGAAQHVYHSHFTPPSTWSAAEPIENNGGQANSPGVAYGVSGMAMAAWRQGSTSATWFNLFDGDSGWGSPGVVDPALTGTAVDGDVFFDPGTGTFHAVWLQSVPSERTSPYWSQFQ